MAGGHAHNMYIVRKIGRNDPCCAEMVIFGPFFEPKWQNRDFFSKNPKMSLPYTYEAATLCKKLEKSYERILRSSLEERTHARTRVNLKVPNPLRGGPNSV